MMEYGLIPDYWRHGVLAQLYKNEGSRGDPLNYRGIALMSVLGKWFTKALATKLSNYMCGTTQPNPLLTNSAKLQDQQS